MAAKKTYAQEAKTIMGKYKTRLGEKFDKGDTLALEAMNQELHGLQRKQEKARIQKLIEGASDEQISQLSQALQQPQPQQQPQQQSSQPYVGEQARQIQEGERPLFASPSGQSQLATGGNLPQYQGTGINPNFLNAQNYGNQQQLIAPINYQNPQTGAFTNIPGAQQQQGGGVSFGNRSMLAGQGDFNALQAANQSPANLGYNPITSLGQYQDQASFGAYDDPSEFLASQEMTGQNALNAPSNLATNQLGNAGDAGDGFNQFNSRVPYFGAVAQGIGSLIGNRNIDFDPYEVKDIQAERLSPRTVDYSRGREQIQRERDLAQAQIRGAAKGRGTQQGVTQTTIAGATAAQRVAGSEFEKSVESEGNVNAQIRNEVAARNQQSQLQAAVSNQRNQQYGFQMSRENQMINEQRRSQRVGGVTSAITGYGKDLMASDQYDQMLQIMAPENYQFGEDRDSLFRRLAQVSPTMKRSFSDLGQRLYNKNG